MNKRLVLRLLGAILLIEALAMAPSLAISLLYGDGDALALLSSMALLAALGGFHVQLKLPLVGNAQDAACLGALGHFRQLDGVKFLVAVCADGVFAV